MTRPTDVHEWLQARARAHAEGWNGKWSWSINEQEAVSLSAKGGYVDFDLIRDNEFRGPTEDLEAMVDAHNESRKAYKALDAVLDLHQPKMGFLAPSREKQPTGCTICEPWTWPCLTVAAIAEAAGVRPPMKPRGERDE